MKTKYFLFTNHTKVQELFKTFIGVSPYDFWVCDYNEFKLVKEAAEEIGYVFVHRANQILKDQEYITYQCVFLFDYIESQ